MFKGLTHFMLFAAMLVCACGTSAWANVLSDATELDQNYTYAEPTVISVSGATGNNTPYSFIQNNILVSATKGAQTANYFGCNAGYDISFTATQEIKGVVINGYVKKGFEATASSGNIDYVDASEDYVEADPVVIVTDVNSTTLTLSCLKQLRVYNIEFYFEANPEAEIGGGGSGDYNHDYEPTQSTTLNIEMQDAVYMDLSASYGFDYTEVFLENDDFYLDMGIFAPSIGGTGVAVGTYPINETYALGTVQASPGGDEYYDYPTFLATDFDDEGYYNKSYYLVSGTLSVEANNGAAVYTVSAKSYYGSTINISFSGVVAEYTDDAIESIGSDTAAPRSAKMLKDGRFLIQHGKHLFDATGIISDNSK